jgi:hypothetical protein
MNLIRIPIFAKKMIKVIEIYPTDFSKWKTDMIRRAFGLEKTKELPSLTDWMNHNPPALVGRDLFSIQLALDQFGDRARFVSESDIKMKLLGPAINASGFDNAKFSTFGEIYIKTELTTLDGTKLKVSGRPDLVVAMGEIEASLPYFCMQEYKRQSGTKSDPQGQVLIEMLAARQVNLKEGNELKAVYGAFTLGREINFLTLEGSKYALSKTYLLDVEQDLIDVTMRIRALKYIIADLIGVTV